MSKLEAKMRVVNAYMAANHVLSKQRPNQVPNAASVAALKAWSDSLGVVAKMMGRK